MKDNPTEPIERPVTETARLIEGLQELAGDQQALKKWLQTPNQAFEKQTPLSVVKSGKSDRLWEMIHQLRQGSFA